MVTRVIQAALITFRSRNTQALVECAASRNTQALAECAASRNTKLWLNMLRLVAKLQLCMHQSCARSCVII